MLKLARFIQLAEKVQSAQIQRCLSTTPALSKTVQAKLKEESKPAPEEDLSFSHEEQRETLEMLIDPTQKFFEEVNNPDKNDALERVDDESLKGLWEMGAFALQVPQI
nr:unnamed protein product [Callosobruchus chinensis]